MQGTKDLEGLNPLLAESGPVKEARGLAKIGKWKKRLHRDSHHSGAYLTLAGACPAGAFEFTDWRRPAE